MWAKILTPLVEYQLSKQDVTRLCSGVDAQALSRNDSYPLTLHCAVLLCMKSDLRLWRQICIKRECIKAVKLWGHTCHSLPGSRNISHSGYWQVALPEVLLTQLLRYLILSADLLYTWIWQHFDVAGRCYVNNFSPLSVTWPHSSLHACPSLTF